MKMTQSSQNGWKTLWEKGKLLVTSNLSFSHSVFKQLALQKPGLVWERVKGEIDNQCYVKGGGALKMDLQEV